VATRRSFFLSTRKKFSLGDFQDLALSAHDEFGLFGLGKARYVAGR
jgi:hypothetical protein